MSYDKLKMYSSFMLDEYSEFIKGIFEELGYTTVGEYFPRGVEEPDKRYLHANLPVLGFEAEISVIVQIFQRDVTTKDVEEFVQIVGNNDLGSEIGIIITTKNFTGNAIKVGIFNPHKNKFILVDGEELIELRNRAFGWSGDEGS